MGYLDSCVLQYKLNENAANSTVVDSVGSHTGSAAELDKTPVNTSVLSSVGKLPAGTPLAYDFDKQYYIYTPSTSDITFGDGTNDSPFSISLWVYYEVVATQSQMVYKGTSSDWEYNLAVMNAPPGYPGETYVQCSLKDNSESAVAARAGYKIGWNFPIETWTHVVATYDGRGGNSAYDGIEIYVNTSASVNQRSSSGGTYVAMEDTGENLGVGSKDDTGNFSTSGKLDDVRIYNVELTQTQINELYNGGAGTEAGIGGATTFVMPTNQSR